MAYDGELKRANLQLRAFLYKNLYYHPKVNGANVAATAKIETVFNHYMAHPEELGETTNERLKKEGLSRTVCDYIAGMTDRYALDEYQNLFDVQARNS